MVSALPSSHRATANDPSSPHARNRTSGMRSEEVKEACPHIPEIVTLIRAIKDLSMFESEYDFGKPPCGLTLRSVPEIVLNAKFAAHGEPAAFDLSKAYKRVVERALDGDGEPRLTNAA